MEKIDSINIHCRWFDSNTERERIQRLILKGKVEGEIIQHNETGEDYWGWWKRS